jgi:hypothetical protein
MGQASDREEKFAAESGTMGLRCIHLDLLRSRSRLSAAPREEGTPPPVSDLSAPASNSIRARNDLAGSGPF